MQNGYQQAITQAAENLDYEKEIVEMYGAEIARTLTPEERRQIMVEIEKDFYRNTHQY